MRTFLENRLPDRRKQHGLSLIELMLSMTLGLMIVLGMSTLFIQNRASFRQDELIAQMQDDARFAMNELIRDVSLAGFWASLLDPSAITVHASAGLTQDCGDGTAQWIYDPTLAITSFDEPGAATTPSANFDCLTDAEVQSDTDIMAIKRVVGSPTAFASLLTNRMYLETNGITGLLFEKESGAWTPVVTGIVNYWEYRPAVYFVQNYENTAGDGVPTLCRYLLQSAGSDPTMTKECLASGVEDLQIEYGIDSDDDGTANQYISGPTAAQLANLVSVRISLLFRSVDIDPAYTSNKTITIGNKPAYSPTDQYYRRVFTTTVNVRNPTNLRSIT